MSSAPIGVVASGFSIPALKQILVNYQQAVLANVNAALDLSADAPEGELLAILANADAATYQLMESVYSQFDPDEAEGVGLDNIGAIRNVQREGPTFTLVLCDLMIDAGDAPYAAFTLKANVYGFPSQTFWNQVAVTSDMISGGAATGITFLSTEVGPTPAIVAGTLTQITAPVTGWTSITNPDEQFVLGQSEEPDSTYLARQDEEIGILGSCTPPAIVSSLYELLASVYGAAGQVGPYSVSFFNNTSLSPVTFGATLTLPGKSFAVVLYDPNNLVPATGLADAAPDSGQGSIAATIWQNRPDGIPSSGSIAGTIADQYQGEQTVYWSEPSFELLYISATVAIYPGQVWATVSAAVIDALLAAAIAPTSASVLPPVGQLKPGATLIGAQFKAVISGVAGVADSEAPSVPGGAATPLAFDFIPSPTNTKPIALDPLTAPKLLKANVTLTQGLYP